MSTHWRLPKGVDEVLPPQAWELERLRRRVLDVFVSWGYELPRTTGDRVFGCATGW